MSGMEMTFSNRLKRLLKERDALVGKLLESLKTSPFIHVDETGWRIDGDNHWLWKFSDKKICVSHIDKSRGQKVVEDMLGKSYGGAKSSQKPNNGALCIYSGI